MKKILIFLFFVFILSGCATYRFQKPATSGAVGYLACYDGKPLLEYTVGKEKSLPNLTLAKERFKRRRSTVEYYYKKMDKIESRLKYYFWDPPVMLVDLLGGVLRWPFTAVADYKYNRNLEYKERVDRLDEEKETLEKLRQDSLKAKLDAYILTDLEQETLPSGKAAVITAESKSLEKVVPALEQAAPQEIVSQTPAAVLISAPVVKPPKKNKLVVMKPVVSKAVLELPVAVIVAKPVKGNSPLKVNFSGQKSYSKSGKVIAYNWDFGDGDISTKKNPENTYWSTTFGSRNFTVTLTVRDNAGSVSSTTAIIEVSTL